MTELQQLATYLTGKLNQIIAAVNGKLNLSGGTMTGDINSGGNDFNLSQNDDKLGIGEDGASLSHDSNDDLITLDLSSSAGVAVKNAAAIKSILNFLATADRTISFQDKDYTIAGLDDITAAIDNLIDSSPGALDTLNELAAALGDDPNFAATMTSALAGKLSLSGGTMTGDINLVGNKILATILTLVASGNSVRLENSGGHQISIDISGITGTKVVTFQNKAQTVATLDDIVPSALIGVISADASHTGNTTETVLGYIEIPANTYQAGDLLEYMWTVKKETVLDSFQNTVYINTSPNLTGSPVQLSTYFTNNRTHKQNREFLVKSSSQLFSFFERLQGNVTNYPHGGNNYVVADLEFAVDLTVTNYLIIATTLSDASETATLKGMTLKKYRV